jgi:hypothetical protein
MTGCASIASALLDAGANAQARDQTRKIPLHLATAPDVVALLQAHPAAVAAAARAAPAAPPHAPLPQPRQHNGARVGRRDEEMAEADSTQPQWLRNVKNFFK